MCEVRFLTIVSRCTVERSMQLLIRLVSTHQSAVQASELTIFVAAWKAHAPVALRGCLRRHQATWGFTTRHEPVRDVSDPTTQLQVETERFARDSVICVSKKQLAGASG